MAICRRFGSGCRQRPTLRRLTVATYVVVVAGRFHRLRPVQTGISTSYIFGWIIVDRNITGGTASIIVITRTSSVAVNICLILIC
jgi:hypothetical protein